MSLGKTLLKVAIGIVVAKGVSAVVKGSGSSAPDRSADRTTGRNTGRGTRIEPQDRGGLEDMLGDMLGRKNTTTQRSGSTKRSKDGGLEDILDQIAGKKKSTPRKTAPKGGLDDLFGQLTGQKQGRSTGRSSGGVGDLLDQVMGGRPSGRPMELPEPGRDAEEEEVSAALLLRAMIQAVKCDGDLDADEKRRLMEAMGEADEAEVRAVNEELSRPVDVEGLADLVPAGMEPQVYTASLMAIDLDRQEEAQYLHALAQALDLTPEEVNALHDRAGAPRLYR